MEGFGGVWGNVGSCGGFWMGEGSVGSRLCEISE